MFARKFRLLTVLTLALGLGFGATARAAAHNLISATASPYLAQHINDPVQWRAWGPEALAEATRTGKPIFLSIGYSACHWCHVMQRESFTDADVAKRLNQNFVPVLIDQESLPDIDAVFQEAAAAAGFPTGWPLNLFLTSDGKLFWGSGYLPNTARGGLPAFGHMVTQIAEAFASSNGSVASTVRKLERRLQERLSSVPGEITPQRLTAESERLLALSDPFYGGFGAAPKFPNVEALELLWRAYIRNGEQKYLDAVLLALDNMLLGGLYDHVGGGFFRYTTDAHWQAPHFEKMLDVNARLLSLMVEVWRETESDVLKKTIEGTATFLIRDLRLSNGGFASSLDADRFHYIWNRPEIDAVLTTDSQRFWEFFRLEPEEEQAATDRGVLILVEDAKTNNRFASHALKRLKTSRDKRPRPRRDDKVLADWNAYAIQALASAGQTFDRADWTTAAQHTFDFVVATLSQPDGRLHHSGYAGLRGTPATLDDLAAMAAAAIGLAEIDGDTARLGLARRWLDSVEAYHGNADDGYFATATDPQTLGKTMLRFRRAL